MPLSSDIITILFVCVCVVRKILNIFKIHSLGNFLVYNTVFTVITVLYIRSPECAHLTAGSLCPLISISPFSPLPGPERLPLYSVSVAFRFHIHMILHIVCVSLTSFP